MTDTLAALAICAAAEWKPSNSSEIFETCGLEFFTSPGSQPADLEIAIINGDTTALRWSAKGRLHIMIAIAIGAECETVISNFEISAATERF